MKKSVLFGVTGFIGMALTINAFAYGSNGGSDSCGLGWEVTQKKSLLATLTRGTTHAFLPPTYSMTTGTSGCDQHSIALKDQEAAKYAMANYEPLTFEMAAGKGETLEGFAQTLGCEDTIAFGRMTQRHFEKLVGENMNSMELFTNVKNAGCGA